MKMVLQTALLNSSSYHKKHKTMTPEKINGILGDEAQDLLTYKCTKVPKERLHLPSADFLDQHFVFSNRTPQTLRSLAQLYGAGRLGGTGYVSILPIDQGIEHSGGASFAANPMYFDPENIVKLAIEGGCNGVATTYGGLALMSRKYAHKIPFIVKINHNELLTYPNSFEQIMFGTVRDAWNLGAVAVGATIYFGSADARRQITEVAAAFEEAHSLGMATILWCYLRNDAFKTGGKDYHVAADLTGQANHLGVTIQADIIKQKLPENNGGYKALNMGSSSYGKLDERMYTDLATDHPIDLCRYQVLNCYSGRIGLINSGGASSGAGDLKEAVKTAVINKRAGGMGLISGRKAFQRPFEEGVSLLHSIQDVYLSKEIDVA
jgi:class I fructose-bisphosphate aldolase